MKALAQIENLVVFQYGAPNFYIFFLPNEQAVNVLDGNYINL